MRRSLLSSRLIPTGFTVWSCDEWNSRIEHRPDWSASLPWAMCVRGTEIGCAGTLCEALAHMTRSGVRFAPNWYRW